MQLVLASSSKGRKKILQSLGLTFKVIPSSIDEEKIIDQSPLKTLRLRAKLKGEEVVEKVQSSKFKVQSNKTFFILSADSGAILDKELIGKPRDYQEAMNILKKLSGKTHEFVTAIYAIHIELKVKSKKFQHHRKPQKHLGGVPELACSELVESAEGLLRGEEISNSREDNNKTSKTRSDLVRRAWEGYERSFVTFKKLSKEDINLYLSLTDYTRYAGGYTLFASPQNFVSRVEGSLSNVIGLPLEKVIPILKENKLPFFSPNVQT